MGFVQADGLDHEVLHARRDQVAVQAVAEGAGFVATMHRRGQWELGLDPGQELGGGELLRRLGRAVIEDADHDDGVGVDVQAQLVGGQWGGARGLIRASVGGIECLG